MKKQFKALEFIYQDVQIHFLVNPLEKNVMINATEMAKAFDKRTSHYLANDKTKELISKLELTGKSVNSDFKVLENRGHMGYYFCELLAIDFATWLDVDFKIWVYQRIQDVIFGNYKKHWEAHARQEFAKQKMEEYKKQILTEPTPEKVARYFEHEKDYQNAKYDKTKAIQNQLKLFVD